MAVWLTKRYHDLVCTSSRLFPPFVADCFLSKFPLLFTNATDFLKLFWGGKHKSFNQNTWPRIYITSRILRAALKKSGFAIGCHRFPVETLEVVEAVRWWQTPYVEKNGETQKPTYKIFVAGWTSRVNTTKTGAIQIIIMLSPQAKVMF